MRILYVDIDSLRPDHLGCYGYARPTSPTIDRVAAGGVRFSRYFASDSPCVPSRAAAFSGRPGIRNGIVTHESTPQGARMRYAPLDRAGRAPMLMHHLVHHGYRTVSFSSFANRHLAGWFHLGFKEFHLTSLKNGDEDAPEVNELALPWLERFSRTEDWFMHLNYWDPHTLYTEPVAYMHEMSRHPAPQWPDAETIREQQSLTGIRTAATPWELHAPETTRLEPRVPTMPCRIGNRADFEHLINGYDGGIRYADEQLQVLLDELDRQGVLEETAIIVSADHGEAFGELGQYMEHGSVSPAVHRVPLVVRWPGLTGAAAALERDDLLLNLDLAPTVADALGLEQPAGWTGRSFLPALRGQSLGSPRERAIWTHGLHTRQRAVYDGRYLLVRTYEPSYYLYEPRMLFDLRADPHQTHDLASAEPDRVRAMEADLIEWEGAQVEATGEPDPMREIQWKPPFLLSPYDKVLEHLRANGRDADAERLEAQRARIHEYAPAPLA